MKSIALALRVRLNAGLAGLMLGVLTTVVYMIGSGRTFGFDSAVSFGNFVATGSMLDAVGRATGVDNSSLAYASQNNHVLVSVVSHLIYSATGSRSEAVYRFLPAAGAGVTVGLLVHFLGRRFGLLAGIVAGVFVATNPLFVQNSRELRGYSVMAALVVLATVLLLEDSGPRRRGWYGLCLAGAIAAQLVAVPVVLFHVVLLAVTRPRELKATAPAWVLGVLAGLLANVATTAIEALNGGLPARFFQPGFPSDLVIFLLGGPFPIVLGLCLPVALLGLWPLRREPWLLPLAAVMVATVAVLWLVVQPLYLYPRFFFYLVPGCAFLIAAAIARWPLVGAVVVLAAALSAWSQAPGYTEDPLALRQASAAIRAAHVAGRTPCVLAGDDIVVVAYAQQFKRVASAGELARCDVVVIATWNIDRGVRDAVLRDFPVRQRFPAAYPAFQLSR